MFLDRAGDARTEYEVQSNEMHSTSTGVICVVADYAGHRCGRRRGLSYEEVQARLERQMPLEEKRQYADYVIDTSGSKEETLAQTREVYNSLRSLIQK